jgi:hypothetical protein
LPRLNFSDMGEPEPADLLFCRSNCWTKFNDESKSRLVSMPRSHFSLVSIC